jgi:hypothetical protein
MGFFMRKIQMLLNPFISQPDVFAGVYLPARRSGRETRLHRGNHAKLTSSNSTLTDSPFYHPSNIPLCVALLLSNPHSRSLRAAPRFSPTRFIPPSIRLRLFRDLIASRVWG